MLIVKFAQPICFVLVAALFVPLTKCSAQHQLTSPAAYYVNGVPQAYALTQFQADPSTAFTASTAANKLNVLVLYESLCPDSLLFISDLDSSYDELKPYLAITLVPFGKSAFTGKHFMCQHGPDECRGNLLQSCALNTTTDQDAQVKFVGCQMRSGNTDSIDVCARRAGIPTDISYCLQSDLGTQLQLQAQAITKSYNPRFIPTIVYDWVFDQSLQSRSIQSFRQTVCDLLYSKGIIDSSVNVCRNAYSNFS